MLVLLAPFAAGLGLVLYSGFSAFEVAGREQTATALVTAHRPGDHNNYDYAFEAGGRTYRGSDNSLDPEPRVGGVAKVYFDPQDPARSSFTEFREAGKAELSLVPFMLAGIGVFAAFLILRIRRRPGPPG